MNRDAAVANNVKVIDADAFFMEVTAIGAHFHVRGKLLFESLKDSTDDQREADGGIK